MNYFGSVTHVSTPDIHQIDFADLLGREVVSLQSSVAHIFLQGRTILVTGAAGSIGSELCRQLLDYRPALVIALDTNETGLFDLVESLHTHPYGGHLQLHIGDITDVVHMTRLLERKHPYVVFHAAAYKHVPLLEQHPEQAIRTNALGTYHLCCLAQKYEVEHFVFVSTDKAADPTSVMGASKKFGELVIQSLAREGAGKTCFCAVRFGNVIGSRGSVVPIFSRQIENGGPVTVTDAQATRYFMTIPEACDLVILSAAQAEAGNIYLLDMGKPIRIIDLALKMIRAYNLRTGCAVSIMYTGLRPGERLHEILVAAHEELKATRHSKILCIISPDSPPSLTVIDQWAQELTCLMLAGDDEQLCLKIFACARQRHMTFQYPQANRHSVSARPLTP